MSKDLSDLHFPSSSHSDKSEVSILVPDQEPPLTEKSEGSILVPAQETPTTEKSEVLLQDTAEGPLNQDKSLKIPAQDPSTPQATAKDPLIAKDSLKSSWRASMKISSIRFWFKILWIVLHYFNLWSDYLTLRTFWQEGYKFYFYPLLVCLLISWIIGVSVLWPKMKLPRIPKIFIFLLQLDFALLTLEHPMVESPVEHLNGRKKATLFFQTVPSVFITVHSIFVEQITSIMPHISLVFTIWDFAYSSAAVEMNILTFDDVKDAIIKTLGYGFENSLVWLSWGFLALYTRPWGAWIYFPVANVIYTITALALRNGDRNRCDDCGNLLLGFILIMNYNGKYVDDDNEEVEEDYNLKEINVWIQAIVMWIIMGAAYHEELGNSLEEPIWEIYFYAIIGCASIFIITRLFRFFRSRD